MKSENEIKEQIEFQEKQMDKLSKLLDDDSLIEMKRQDYMRNINRHAARRQALMWALEPTTTAK